MPKYVLLAAAVAMTALVAFDAVPVLHALAGFAVIAGAAWITATQPQQRRSPAQASAATPPRSQPTLDTVIEALPDPVVLVDDDGRVLALNAHAQAIAPALSRGEPVSLGLRAPQIVEAIRRATAEGATQRVEFSERVPIDRWWEAFVVPMRPLVGGGRDGRGHVLVAVHDLTPMRRMEEMRADFVANASHELRTPLASLSGFIETLQGPAREDSVARERFLAIMKTQATRMARLIDDLLSLSRIELSAHLHPETATDLTAIVRQVADALQMLARDRGVGIYIDAPRAPLIVLGDRDELTRVFENLIENALKYGASGKRVEVTLVGMAGVDGDEAVISVRDYGPGIAAEHLPRLTERFYRVDVVQSRAEGGTGLGLALVKHILNRHRGKLTIESESGMGAVFTVRLPIPR
jgi:two-component system phosphate regulon sensor histidine kinase PhoR